MSWLRHWGPGRGVGMPEYAFKVTEADTQFKLMKIELFKKAVLARDFAEHGLVEGDLATVVEFATSKSGEAGYILEVFNTRGETINVISVHESDLRPCSDHG